MGTCDYWIRLRIEIDFAQIAGFVLGLAQDEIACSPVLSCRSASPPPHPHPTPGPDPCLSRRSKEMPAARENFCREKSISRRLRCLRAAATHTRTQGCVCTVPTACVCAQRRKNEGILHNTYESFLLSMPGALILKPVPLSLRLRTGN